MSHPSERMGAAVELARARARLTTAEDSVQTAKDESRAARQKRKEAKDAVRRAKKRLRRATRHFTRQSVCANYSIQAAGIETRDKEILFCQPRSRRSNFIRRKELHRSAADTCSGKGERLSFPSRLGDDGELCNFAAVRD